MQYYLVLVIKLFSFVKYSFCFCFTKMLYPTNRGLSLFNLTGCQMVCMVDFAALILESFLILAGSVLELFYTSVHIQSGSGPSEDQLTKSITHAI